MNESSRNSAGVIILVTLLLSIAYAVLRYHILGQVPWKDIGAGTVERPSVLHF
jgi:hypothetical protein